MRSTAQPPRRSAAPPEGSRTKAWWVRWLDFLLGLCLALLLFVLPLSESLKNILFVSAVVLWLICLALRRERPRLSPAGWGLVAFFVVAVLSAVGGLDRHQAARGAWDVFRYGATFFLMLHGLTSRAQARWCIGALLASIVLGAVLGLVQYWAMEQAFAGQAVNRGTVAVKIHSVGHPNHSATYLVMMFGLALAGALERSYRGAVRAAFAAMVALLAVATVFTYSRAGITLMVLVAAGMLLLTRRGRWMVALVGLALALLVLPSVRATIPQVVAAVQQPMKVGAIYDRVHVWRTVVLGVVRDRPLFGAGPRNFNTIDKRQYGLGYGWDYFDHAHSLYMNVAAEMGVLGLGAFFVWMGLFLRAWWPTRRHLDDGLARCLWLGSGGAFLTITVSGLVTTTLHTEGAMLLTAIWGLFFFVYEEGARAARWQALLGLSLEGGSGRA
ncbi:MAG: O-antigen ligase family protein [Nitrospinota bacterium]